MTGSGKTMLLQRLGAMGEQVIDLEDLAQHKGSAYGSLNKLIQPSQEQFENDLAARLAASDRNRHLWVEDESLAIGKRLIPRPFWDQIQTAPLFDLERPLEERVDALVREYGSLDKEFLVDCTDRIRKRLGSEHAGKAIIAIREGHMDVFVRLVLVYYDKACRTGLKDRQARPVTAAQILDFVDAPLHA
jgi:tRNA 2-selenouridine synthase